MQETDKSKTNFKKETVGGTFFLRKGQKFLVSRLENPGMKKSTNINDRRELKRYMQEITGKKAVKTE